MYRYLLFLLVFLGGFTGFAQPRAIGTWRAYFPYGSATQIEDAGDRIYCASELSIFYVEKEDNSTQALDKASGLSDVGIQKIKYNANTKTLLIAYKNSNIDLLQDGEKIYNISDIKIKMTTGSKNINDVCMLGSYAYLATDLGVAVLDLEKREIKETYVIGAGGENVIINGVATTPTTLFAATKEGVKSASLSNSNLQNFNAWTLHTNGIPATDIKLIAAVGNTVYTGLKDSLLLRYNGSQWDTIFSRNGWKLQSFKTENNKIYAFFWDIANNNQHFILQLSETDIVAETHYPYTSKPLDIIVSEKTWIADKENSLLLYKDTVNQPELFKLQGPYSSHVFNMLVHNNAMYLAAGGTNPGYNSYGYFFDGVQTVQEGWWWRTLPYDLQGAPVLDYLNVAVNKITNKMYYASFQNGLTELDLSTGQITVFNQSNSTLQKEPCCNVVRVPSVCVDDNGNVWMMNTGATKQLAVLKTDGTWKSFSVPYSFELSRKMLVVNNKIWMCNRPGDIIVYDPGNDIDSEADDRYRKIGTGEGNGNLPSSSVWCAVEDKDGYVWVGTEAGIGTFYCPSSLPQEMCDADWIKVDQGGFLGYLFSTEIVRTIAVDGANRKWVGTYNSGVWLISADGKEELLRFTKDNSALPSNGIMDICINQETGEVFIGTDLGLVSYQGDAILGKEDKKGDVLVYPNPVHADYSGVIAVKGLVDDAYVKIADASGKLVYQGRANGGQMVWDGKGYEGERVKSGVYFVYSDTDLGKGKAVAKIVLLN